VRLELKKIKEQGEESNKLVEQVGSLFDYLNYDSLTIMTVNRNSLL